MSKYHENLFKEQIALMEKLADIEHQRWADWQKYCFKKLGINRTDDESSDTERGVSIRRWFRQIDAPYAQLTEAEKDSDREQVMRYWDLIINYNQDKIMPETFNFSAALELLKDGQRVSRAGWHGKDMHLELQKPDVDSKMTLPYVYMVIPCQNCAEAGEKARAFNLVPWLASQTDILAEDWKIVQ